MSWGTCYSGSNNIHFDYPPIMDDGRNYSKWQPAAVLNNEIRKSEGIKTNWEYRNYLVANAGNIPVRESFFQSNIKSIERMIQVNLTGTIYCVYRFTKILIEKNIPGSIVLISSEAARFGGNHISTYAATKAGLNTFVVGAAREIGPYGIRINAVSPGTIMTDSLEAEGDEKLKQIKNSIPLGRIGTTDEASETIHWLLSDKSSYISGSMITVSGGR